MPDPAAMMAVHEEVRRFFKTGLKSSNKEYQPLVPGRPADGWADATKRERRAINRYAAAGARHLLFAGGPPPRSPHEVGRIIATENFSRAGNCAEMACMAAYFVHLRGLGTPWIGLIHRPGDHAFCHVTDGARPSLRDLLSCSADETDDWIIDPWANVCAPVTWYLFGLLRKFRDWDAAGKRIRFVAPGADASRLISPNDVRYRRPHLLTPIVYRHTDPPERKAGPLPR